MPPCSERLQDWIVRSLTGENVQHGLTMLTYINECTDLRGISYFGEVTYQIVFQEDGNVHALVVGLIFLRVLEGFSLSKRLSWLPRTIFLAKNKLFNFVLAYVCLVAGFALLMTLYFGDLFQQYCTLASSCYTLLLFSFGLSERAMYGAEPFVERSSTHLLFMLFLFTVFVVTIILNMFTTIVIDAFAAESDPKRYQAAYKEEITTLTNHLLTIFGKGDLVSKRKSLRSTRHVPALPSEGEARSRASDASDASDAGDAGDAVPEQ
ncbi:unnamed protein product [Effrenium voratum]|nr:unnamed protein product [Effrenium voratum]